MGTKGTTRNKKLPWQFCIHRSLQSPVSVISCYTVNYPWNFSGHREFWKTSRWGAVSLGNVAIPDKSREPRENPVIYGQFGGFSLKNPWMWGPRYSVLLHSLDLLVSLTVELYVYIYIYITTKIHSIPVIVTTSYMTWWSFKHPQLVGCFTHAAKQLEGWPPAAISLIVSSTTRKPR